MASAALLSGVVSGLGTGLGLANAYQKMHRDRVQFDEGQLEVEATKEDNRIQQELQLQSVFGAALKDEKISKNVNGAVSEGLNAAGVQGIANDASNAMTGEPVSANTPPPVANPQSAIPVTPEQMAPAAMARSPEADGSMVTEGPTSVAPVEGISPTPNTAEASTTPYGQGNPAAPADPNSPGYGDVRTPGTATYAFDPAVAEGINAMRRKLQTMAKNGYGDSAEFAKYVALVNGEQRKGFNRAGGAFEKLLKDIGEDGKTDDKEREMVTMAGRQMGEFLPGDFGFTARWNDKKNLAELVVIDKPTGKAAAGGTYELTADNFREQFETARDKFFSDDADPYAAGEAQVGREQATEQYNEERDRAEADTNKVVADTLKVASDMDIGEAEARADIAKAQADAYKTMVDADEKIYMSAAKKEQAIQLANYHGALAYKASISATEGGDDGLTASERLSYFNSAIKIATTIWEQNPDSKLARKFPPQDMLAETERIHQVAPPGYIRHANTLVQVMGMVNAGVPHVAYVYDGNSGDVRAIPYHADRTTPMTQDEYKALIKKANK